MKSFYLPPDIECLQAGSSWKCISYPAVRCEYLRSDPYRKVYQSMILVKLMYLSFD